MSIIDFIKRRTNVTRQKSEGLNLAIYSINEFENRRFTFRGLKNKSSGIEAEELLKLLQEELDSMLILYRYTTRVKKYTDKNGVSQVQIKLIGRAGTMSKYNPLDIELGMATEV